MIFHVCAKCGKVVWFWQSSGTVKLKLKNGKRKRLHLCLRCGESLAAKAIKAAEAK
jgi:hypothetical protein